MSATGLTYDWTDHDKACHPHYGRGKPKELLDAEIDADLAWGRYDRAVDDYHERHYGEQEYHDKAEQLKKAAEEAQDKATDLHNKIYGRKENGQPE